MTAIGCLLFYPAAGSHSYPTFLGALFILASGVTLLQVAGNPYVTLLSKPGKESATLTLVQAFNSLGTTIAPQIGAFLILADATQTVSKAEQISSVQIPYLGLAGLLIILAVFVKMIRLPDANKIAEEESEHNHDGKHSVWQYRHLVFWCGQYFLLCRCGSIHRFFIGQRVGLSERFGPRICRKISVVLLGRCNGRPFLRLCHHGENCA